MSKKCYRFYGGLLTSQEKWLNRMAERGYSQLAEAKLMRPARIFLIISLFWKWLWMALHASRRRTLPHLRMRT